MMNFFIVVCLFLFPILAQEEKEFLNVPSLTGRVVDLTSTLNESEIQRINNLLLQLEESKKAQMAVLVVNSTLSEPIFDFSFRVAEAWKLGEKDKDNGILLVIALKDRKARLEIGYGVEDKIPDITAKRILSGTIVPNMKKKEYAQGIEDGILKIISSLNGELTDEGSKLTEKKKKDGLFWGELKMDPSRLSSEKEVWIYLGMAIFSFSLGLANAYYGFTNQGFFFFVFVPAMIALNLFSGVSSIFIFLAAFFGFLMAWIFYASRGRSDDSYDISGGSWYGGGSSSSGSSSDGNFWGGGGSFGGGGASDSWGSDSE